MWKNILSMAGLILASSFFVQSLPVAKAALGPSVSLGSNPIVASGGTISGSGSVEVFQVDPSMDLLITDIVLSSKEYSCQASFSLSNAAGETLAAFEMASRSDTYDYATSTASIVHRFASGILVSAGDTLSLVYNSCGASYTLSGRYIQP